MLEKKLEINKKLQKVNQQIINKANEKLELLQKYEKDLSNNAHSDKLKILTDEKQELYKEDERLMEEMYS